MHSFAAKIIHEFFFIATPATPMKKSLFNLSLVFGVLGIFGIGCISLQDKSDADKMSKIEYGNNGFENKDVPCLKENQKKAALRWGEFHSELGIFRAYECDGNLALRKLSKESFAEEFSKEYLTNVKEASFCRLIQESIQNFLKIQTLNAPGEVSRFVEYIPSNNENTRRAVWNPQYSTVGSREFRKLYDSLMVLIPTDKQW